MQNCESPNHRDNPCTVVCLQIFWDEPGVILLAGMTKRSFACSRSLCRAHSPAPGTEGWVHFVCSVGSAQRFGSFTQSQEEEVVTLFESTGDFNRIRDETSDSIHDRLTTLPDQYGSSSVS